MRIVCPACAAAYDVPEQKLSGRASMRCARCGHGWAAQDRGAPTAPAIAVRAEPLLPPVVPVPARPLALAAAWCVSIGAVLVLLALAVAEHRALAHAWPPMGRLYGAVGLRP